MAKKSKLISGWHILGLWSRDAFTYRRRIREHRCSLLGMHFDLTSITEFHPRRGFICFTILANVLGELKSAERQYHFCTMLFGSDLNAISWITNGEGTKHSMEGICEVSLWENVENASLHGSWQHSNWHSLPTTFFLLICEAILWVGERCARTFVNGSRLEALVTVKKLTTIIFVSRLAQSECSGCLGWHRMNMCAENPKLD